MDQRLRSIRLGLQQARLTGSLSVAGGTITGPLSTQSLVVSTLGFEGDGVRRDSAGPLMDAYLRIVINGIIYRIALRSDILAPVPFVMRIQAAGLTFALPLIITGKYNFRVDWGDGTVDQIYAYDDAATSHTYPAEGEYVVTIIGTLVGWRFNNNADAPKVVDIQQWGSDFIPGIDEGEYFFGCTNMIISASDVPNLLYTKSLRGCFRNCAVLDAVSLQEWNTSNIRTMSRLFDGASAFNQNISQWDVSRVTDMSYIFSFASKFNNGQNTNVQGINPSTAFYTNSTRTLTCPGFSNDPVAPQLQVNDEIQILRFSGGNAWYTSTVESINGENIVLSSEIGVNISAGQLLIVQKPSLGTQPLEWNVASLENAEGMFNVAPSFNQSMHSFANAPLTTTVVMFNLAASFNNGDALWQSTVPFVLDTSNVNNMLGTFTNAFGFNQSLNSWDTSRNTNFRNMFLGVNRYNQPLSSWNTSQVTDFAGMFQNAVSFNQNIGNFDVSSAVALNSMFFQARSFDNGSQPDMASWSAPLCQNFASMFRNCNVFNQPLDNLIRSNALPENVTCSCDSMFSGAPMFNQNIGNWDVSKVRAMNNMFQGATLFNNGGNADIVQWRAPRCTTFSQMFVGASSFNQPLSNLVQTSEVQACSLALMFNEAGVFNNGEEGMVPIPNITPSLVQYTNATRTLVCSTAAFLSSIAPGDVLILRTASIVYSSAVESVTDDTTLVLQTAYGSNILSGVTSLQKQIPGTSPLLWDTSNVTSMARLFNRATLFNQDISTFITSRVSDVSLLFEGVSARITLFNNGQIISGMTAPMTKEIGPSMFSWTFDAPPISSNYRNFSRLTAQNKPASLP